MPCLNSDILFEIGLQIIESGDSEAVIRFVLSGSEPLKAMAKIFSTITYLEISRDRYFIGWKNECIEFDFERNDPILEFLMIQSGNHVKELRIDVRDFTPIQQTIIQKIIAKKQLKSAFIGQRCKQKFVKQFLLNFSTTLKNLTISTEFMFPEFRDSFNLESLKVIISDTIKFSKFCCKTKSLDISQTKLCAVNPDFYGKSPHFSSIKELIVNGTNSILEPVEFFQIWKLFPSVDILKYNVEIQHCPKKLRTRYAYYIAVNINCYFLLAKSLFASSISIKPPSKAIYSFNVVKSYFPPGKYPNITDYMKLSSAGFEFDDSIKEYFCFRKIIQSSSGIHSTILELQFSK